MPRQARIDIEGCLYHVIARGLERHKIFSDEVDYKDFLKRLKVSLECTGGKCLAWCLIPNHFHLLILRGRSPLSEIMRRLMTGYAVGVNLRYKRSGHLFQNRYKSILCEKEPYLLELAAYIHLNPLRAHIVENLRELKKYPWCGHGALCAGKGDGIIDVHEVLEHFGLNMPRARLSYEQFVAERVDRFKSGEYSGGGLLKSLGRGVNAINKLDEKEAFDERILGSGEFVESIIKEIEGETFPKPMTKEDVLREVERITGVTKEELLSSGRQPRIARARALYCFLRKTAGGVNGAVLVKELHISSGAASYLAHKGKEIVKREHLSV
ncbi:MAG: transposase [Elusimicrobia bacterium]|nr:transposase [Elusimicrobiota bacterium]